jgi:hypothetical protein
VDQLALLGGGALALLLGITLLPLAVALLQGLSGQDKLEEADRIRTALLALGAGVLATVGAFYTPRTFKLNSSGQITDRFSRAVGELGDANPRVCLGGIYALERIARDSQDDHPQVMEVLTAYLRAGLPVQERLPCQDGWTAQSREGLPNEVQAAVAVLGRRKASWDEHRLDLRGVHLPGVKLPKDADLRGAFLNGASLEAAQLERVDLGTRQLAKDGEPAEAELMDAHLEGANLRGAKLTGAKLTNAHLERADLTEANLTNAHLERADLTGANLEGAMLRGAWVDADTKPETVRTARGVRVRD